MTTDNKLRRIDVHSYSPIASPSGIILERAYQHDHNAVWAWDAIHLARSAKPPLPIPEWCWPVVDDFLRQYREAKPVFCDPESSPEQRESVLWRIMGFGKQGLNNFLQQKRAIALAEPAALDPERQPKHITAKYAKRRLEETVEWATKWRWWW